MSGKPGARGRRLSAWMQRQRREGQEQEGREGMGLEQNWAEALKGRVWADPDPAHPGQGWEKGKSSRRAQLQQLHLLTAQF